MSYLSYVLQLNIVEYNMNVIKRQRYSEAGQNVRVQNIKLLKSKRVPYFYYSYFAMNIVL
jgi:hypothetical protein